MTLAERTPCREVARGKWRDILPSLGIPSKFLSGRHQPCPMCGGKDRARFDDRDGQGTWICGVCGAGNGVDLVMKFNGWDFRTAAARIEAIAGGASARIPSPGPSEQDYRRWRNEAWIAASPVQPHDPVGLYLHRRNGLTAFPRCLRFHPSLEHRDEDGRKTYHPAMLAIVAGADGKPANLHRTYLTAEGEKAPIEPPRRMMPGEIPAGAAIRLCAAAETMGVAEGIETAYAASALFDMPVWSTISDRILAKFRAPDGVKRLVVFGDHDPGYAGQAAAFACARANSGRGITVEVRVPEEAGTDWNDVQRSAAFQRAS